LKGTKERIGVFKAEQEGDPALSQIKYLSKFDFVRDDPQFQEIVKEIGY